MELIPQVYWGVMSGVLFFVGTFVMSKNSLSRLVASEYHYKDSPSPTYKMLGYLCGIKSRADASKEFMGGTWDEIKTNTDAGAVARGLAWSVFGFVTLILSIFAVGPVLSF